MLFGVLLPQNPWINLQSQVSCHPSLTGQHYLIALHPPTSLTPSFDHFVVKGTTYPDPCFSVSGQPATSLIVEPGLLPGRRPIVCILPFELLSLTNQHRCQTLLYPVASASLFTTSSRPRCDHGVHTVHQRAEDPRISLLFFLFAFARPHE